MNKGSKYSEDIRRLYRHINNPGGSTSPKHRALHKIYTYWRILNPYYQDLGRLRSISSEMVIYTDVPNDGYVRKVDGEFVLKPNYKYSKTGFWRSDCFETWQRKNGKKTTQSVAVEVLSEYPINAFFENSRKGRKEATKFKEYLLKMDYIGMKTFSNIENQIKTQPFGVDLSIPYKRIHFWLDSDINRRKADYGDFSESVDKISEIERKHFLWDHSTDYLIFVAFDDNIPACKDSLEILLKKKDKLNVPLIFSINEAQFRPIILASSGLKNMYETVKPPSGLSRKRKKDLFKINIIEGFDY